MKQIIFNWNSLNLDLKATAEPLEFEAMLKRYYLSKYEFESNCSQDCFSCNFNWIQETQVSNFQILFIWKGPLPCRPTPVWVACMRETWVGSLGWGVAPTQSPYYKGLNTKSLWRIKLVLENLFLKNYENILFFPSAWPTILKTNLSSYFSWKIAMTKVLSMFCVFSFCYSILLLYIIILLLYYSFSV